MKREAYDYKATLEIGEWEYPFEKLPNWDIHAKIPYVYDELSESPQGDTAALIYSIVEYRMGWCAGCLAVFQNKATPDLILDPNAVKWSKAYASFSAGGKYLFVPAGYFLNENELPIFIFNIAEITFSILRVQNGIHYISIDLDGGFRLA